MLEEIFYPKSIAVVGASRNKEKIGNIIFRNLISTFKGNAYPVNNRAENVEERKAYRSLTEIPDHVDLAIISVPREVVPEVLEDMGKAGVRGGIVISSGFRETGPEGAKLEDEIKAIAKRNGIRFLGPNTMGIVTPSFNATFTYVDVKPGNIALVAQSGGMGAYMLNWAQRTRTGLSYFIGLGNQADITETDVFQFLAEDAETRAIFTYIEGVSDGERFLNVMPDVTKSKPVVFIKGGASQAGAQAVMTHTGSLAGSYQLFKAAVRTVGGIFVDNLNDFLNLAKMINTNETYKPGLLIVTNSGGHGVLTVDEAERTGLQLIKLPPTATNALNMVLPSHATIRNPLDLGGDANVERYITALKIVQGLDCTKLVIVQSLATVSCVEVAKALQAFKGRGFVGVVMGLGEDAAARILDSSNMPAFRYPEEAVRAIKYITQPRDSTRKIRAPEPIEAAKKLIEGKSALSDIDALKLMEIYGIRVPPWAVADDLASAKESAAKIGYPVVMKMSSDQPVHKTELGGVYLNIEEDNIEDAFNRLSAISKRVLIQKQLDGVEVFVGGIRDPTFGPSVLVGLGGVYVEVMKSISYGLSPVSEDEALLMIKESKVYDLLTARKRNYSVNSVLRVLSRLSRLIVDLNVKELDINPLIVNRDGAFAVDVRVVL